MAPPHYIPHYGLAGIPFFLGDTIYFNIPVGILISDLDAGAANSTVIELKKHIKTRKLINKLNYDQM